MPFIDAKGQIVISVYVKHLSGTFKLDNSNFGDTSPSLLVLSTGRDLRSSQGVAAGSQPWP